MENTEDLPTVLTRLANGVKLTSRYIERIKELGIVVMYIFDESVGDIQADDVVSEKTRLEAIKVTKEAMENIKLNPTLNLAGINEAVNDIINELLNNCDTMVNLVEIRAMNDYTFGQRKCCRSLTYYRHNDGL